MDTPTQRTAQPPPPVKKAARARGHDGGLAEPRGVPALGRRNALRVGRDQLDHRGRVEVPGKAVRLGEEEAYICRAALQILLHQCSSTQRAEPRGEADVSDSLKKAVGAAQHLPTSLSISSRAKTSREAATALARWTRANLPSRP